MVETKFLRIFLWKKNDAIKQLYALTKQIQCRVFLILPGRYVRGLASVNVDIYPIWLYEFFFIPVITLTWRLNHWW